MGTMFIQTPNGAERVGGGGGVNVTASVGQTIVVKEVDANGKPTKWEAADYQPRTHWSEETVGDLVPHTVFTPVLYETFGCTFYPVAPFQIEEGKAYTVIFDGTEYHCIAQAFDMGAMKGVGMGNPVFIGGENNDMPFVVSHIEATSTLTGGGVTTVVAVQETYAVLCMDAQQHTIRVIGEKRVYNKIPVEYAKSDFVIRLSKNFANGELVMVTPWEDIADALSANKNIYAAFDDSGYELNTYGDLDWRFNLSARWLCIYAKIGIDTSKCILNFIGCNERGFTAFISCTRDENGVTTITNYDT